MIDHTIYRRHLTRYKRPNAWRTLIIYAALEGGECREIIDADEDWEYENWILPVRGLHPNEGAVMVRHADYDAMNSPFVLAHFIARQAGFAQAPDPRLSVHALVDRHGVVRNMIHVHETCGDYAHAHLHGKGARFIRCDYAAPGWRLREDGAFAEPRPQERAEYERQERQRIARYSARSEKERRRDRSGIQEATCSVIGRGVCDLHGSGPIWLRREIQPSAGRNGALDPAAIELDQVLLTPPRLSAAG